MSRTLITTLAALCAASLDAATWEIDPSHSSAEFAIRHLMVSTVRGAFATVKGTAQYDPADVAASRLDVTIDVASINTRQAKRDAHLKSADFFDVQKFPSITFRGTKFARAGKRGMKITGDLTMHGVTRPVVLDVEGPSPEVKGPGGARIGATAKARISRKDFGMLWNQVLEAGGLSLSDSVDIIIDVELIKK